MRSDAIAFKVARALIHTQYHSALVRTLIFYDGFISLLIIPGICAQNRYEEAQMLAKRATEDRLRAQQEAKRRSEVHS